MRKQFGNLTTKNTTSNELIKGANIQWLRYNDSSFQDKEFDQKVYQVFGNQK